MISKNDKNTSNVNNKKNCKLFVLWQRLRGAQDKPITCVG